MSENTNPTAEELVRNVTFSLQRSNTVPTPIDPTLSHEGEAADAKATGDAIEGVFSGAKVNGKSFVDKEATVYAGDILMSDATGAQSIRQAIEGIGDKDASEIMYDAENLVTIADALDDVYDKLDTELTEEQIDEIFDEVFGGDD